MMDRFTGIAVTRIAFSCCIAFAVLWLSYPALGAPGPEKALGLKPVQRDVDYQLVPPDSVAQCRVVDIRRKGWFGWEVIGPDGAMLRRFADTDGDKSIDTWSYFQYGVEVYRDIDEDGNGKADQYRWMATGGTRWGLDDDEDGRIDRWKQISAEEVSAEVVAAIRDRDANRFAALLISDREVQGLGLGKEKASTITTKSRRAAQDFGGLADRQKAVGAGAKWVQFAAPSPGVVPSGTAGSTEDLVVYENAVAMYEQGEKSGQLMVGTMIQVGSAWRLVDLPGVGDDGEGLAQTAGNFFTPGGGSTARSDMPNIGSETQELVNLLEAIDGKMATATDKKDIADLHDRRATVVEKLIDRSANRGERDTWVRQLVDTLSVATQTGDYPDGEKRLRRVARQFAGDDIALRAYADFQAIGTEYVVRQTPKADFADVQKWYLDALKGFVDRYPETREAAQAWLQLALSREFEDREKEALSYYKKVAASFPGTDEGEKAAGAVRRLDSIGRRIDLKGRTIDGKAFQLSDLRGRPVVLHYWATWCEPCKQDLKLLRRLQASYQKQGLAVGRGKCRCDAVRRRELSAGYSVALGPAFRRGWSGSQSACQSFWSPNTPNHDGHRFRRESGSAQCSCSGA
jgi:hypothetical protein